jgi:septum formation protein
MTSRPRLILASSSPQRRAILETLGVDFLTCIPGVDELAAGEPAAVALENAVRKARVVADGAAADHGLPVLGVDTLVAVGSAIYGKPADETSARATLAALSGRIHTVLSGLALIGSDGVLRSTTVVTGVRVRRLSASLIDWYVATGEWRGRAGGYAIQGRGIALVAGIDGDYSNVVGLPVSGLLDLWPDLLDS